MEAYINGVLSRKVTNLVEEVDFKGMEKDKVCRINQQLDGKVRSFKYSPSINHIFKYLTKFCGKNCLKRVSIFPR